MRREDRGKVNQLPYDSKLRKSSRCKWSAKKSVLRAAPRTDFRDFYRDRYGRTPKVERKRLGCRSRPLPHCFCQSCTSHWRNLWNSIQESRSSKALRISEVWRMDIFNHVAARLLLLCLRDAISPKSCCIGLMRPQSRPHRTEVGT